MADVPIDPMQQTLSIVGLVVGLIAHRVVDVGDHALVRAEALQGHELGCHRNVRRRRATFGSFPPIYCGPPVPHPVGQLSEPFFGHESREVVDQAVVVGAGLDPDGFAGS